jgi:hypothetical protein
LFSLLDGRMLFLLYLLPSSSGGRETIERENRENREREKGRRGREKRESRANQRLKKNRVTLPIFGSSVFYL